MFKPPAEIHTIDQVLQRMDSLWFQLSIRSTSPEIFRNNVYFGIPNISQVLLVLKEHKGGGGRTFIGLEEEKRRGGEDRGGVE